MPVLVQYHFTIAKHKMKVAISHINLTHGEILFDYLTKDWIITIVFLLRSLNTKIKHGKKTRFLV